MSVVARAMVVWMALGSGGAAGLSWPSVAVAQAGGSRAAGVTIEDVRAAERRAQDPGLSVRDREALADRAIELRRALIRLTPTEDPRLSDWQAQHAASLLGRLARDASDTAVIYGLASAAQRREVEAAALEALEVLSEAQRHAEALLARLGGPGSEQAGAAEAEQLVAVRLPFFMGRAQLLRAAVSEGAERSLAASRALESVGRLALEATGPEATRRAIAAGARLLRETPVGAADAAQAADEAGWVVAQAEGAGVPMAARVEAWLALLVVAEAQGRLEAVVERFEAALRSPPLADGQGRVDALVASLGADALTRAEWSRGVREGRGELLDRALSWQTRLLSRGDLSVRAETLMPIVHEKVAGLDLPGGGGLALPPLAQLSRAIVASRDPARRGSALASLQVLGESESAGELAAEALWERAVMLLQPALGQTQASAADRAEAAEALASLADRFPQHARAGAALSASLLHARALAQGDGPGARARYRRVLALATERFHELERIDLWRYERGRLAAEDLAAGVASEDELLAAARAVREIPATPGAGLVGPSEGGGSGVSVGDVWRLGERLQGAVLDRWWDRVRELRARGQEGRLRSLAVDRLAVEARLAGRWASERGLSAAADRFRLDWADALVEGGDAGGREVYRSLLAGEARTPGGRARLELGLARALLAAGDEAGAFALLREASARSDAPLAASEPRSRPEVFWHSWVLMLETLGRQNADGSRSGAIRAHLRRLESIDPGLGGPPWAGRLRRVEASLGR